MSYTPFGFSGGYTDATNLVYFINRYYDPTTGTFVSVDPDVGVSGQPYSYTGDDPVNGVDPLGLWPCLSFHCIASDVGSLAGVVSAVTGVIGLAIPVFTAISEGAAGVAVAADIAACATGTCNYAAVALDALALVPGAAALHFASTAARDEAELEALEELGKVDSSLANSKGFNDLVSKLAGVKGVELSTAAAAINKLDQGSTKNC
jgi:RHS repeat-associated protein